MSNSNLKRSLDSSNSNFDSKKRKIFLPDVTSEVSSGSNLPKEQGSSNSFNLPLNIANNDDLEIKEEIKNSITKFVLLTERSKKYLENLIYQISHKNKTKLTIQNIMKEIGLQEKFYNRVGSIFYKEQTSNFYFFFDQNISNLYKNIKKESRAEFYKDLDKESIYEKKINLIENLLQKTKKNLSYKLLADEIFCAIIGIQKIFEKEDGLKKFFPKTTKKVLNQGYLPKEEFTLKLEAIIDKIKTKSQTNKEYLKKWKISHIYKKFQEKLGDFYKIPINFLYFLLGTSNYNKKDFLISKYHTDRPISDKILKDDILKAIKKFKSYDLSHSFLADELFVKRTKITCFLNTHPEIKKLYDEKKKHGTKDYQNFIKEIIENLDSIFESHTQVLKFLAEKIYLNSERFSCLRKIFSTSEELYDLIDEKIEKNIVNISCKNKLKISNQLKRLNSQSNKSDNLSNLNLTNDYQSQTKKTNFENDSSLSSISEEISEIKNAEKERMEEKIIKSLEKEKKIYGYYVDDDEDRLSLILLPFKKNFYLVEIKNKGSFDKQGRFIVDFQRELNLNEINLLKKAIEKHGIKYVLENGVHVERDLSEKLVLLGSDEVFSFSQAR